MTLIVTAALTLLALPAALTCGYLLLLTLLSARTTAPASGVPGLRFDVIVPAHNEAMMIERCIASLQQLSWPQADFRIRVIADNCDDDTAALARLAGAEVLERSDHQRRGKAYALDRAFNQSLGEGWSDAIVIVDADTVVSRNLLSAFALRLQRGAGAMQARYGVLDAQMHWRTRLMAVAFGAFHDLRSLARERLRLSCGLRGNGWCVSCDLLRRHPCNAFSQTEDLEYGIDLGLAGERVHYVDEARADAEMFTGEASSAVQRQRWESGRRLLMQQRTLPLLQRALQRRDRVCLDLALDLLVLPLSQVALNVGLLLATAAVAARWLSAAHGWLWLGSACAGVLLLYVLRGWQLSGVGIRAFTALARAPLFMLWSLQLRLRRNTGAWRDARANRRQIR